MKKIIYCLIIIICLVLSIGCGNKKETNDVSKKANDVLTKESSNKKDSNILIVYFSRTGENYNVGNVDVGNTAIMASYMKEYLDADSFEIIPTQKYPDSYDECLEVATKEQKEKARPEIEKKLDNIDNYDTIFIGYPIWWGDMPMIIYTFLENYDLSGKTVIPFNTHEGSGNAGTYDTIKNMLKDSDVKVNGLALKGSTARKAEGKRTTINWLKDLGY